MAAPRSDEEQAEKSFTVSDKRLFNKDGARRAPTEGAAAAAATSAPPPPPPPRPEAPRPEATQRRAAAEPPPPSRDVSSADFSNFVIMLANNIMVALGQVPDPMTQQRRRDLQQAQHTIDILMMLREKTRGNLSPDEERLMQELLPQLQMAFVASRRQPG